MWIVDYLGKFCICVDLKRYPIRNDFVHTGELLGRTELGVEWLGGNLTLQDTTSKTFVVDHWIVGPHHFWKDVETQKILRQWQPFNGLEVFEPNSWAELSNDSV